MTPNKTCNGSCQPSCCESTPPTTVPMSVHNPAGLTVLRGRVGDHRSFFESLRRRLSSQQYPHLSELTTRSLTDPTIALLDSWSVVCDVLTFYNERYLQEAYQRTAKEARSLQELSKLIGYRPGPGVASSVYLAFTLEKSPEQASRETLIKKGTKVQSLPGANESAQTFETMEDLVARPEWSAIRPRQTRPQDITEDNIQQIERVTFDGTSTKLVPNDLILFEFENSKYRVIRYVKQISVDFKEATTRVELTPLSLSASKFADDMRQAIRKFESTLSEQPQSLGFIRDLIGYSEALLQKLWPESGLVTLDELVDQAKNRWTEQIRALESVGKKIQEVVEALNIDNFMIDAEARLKPSIQTFLEQQKLLDDVINILKSSWEGNNGISGSTDVGEMRKKVEAAIGDAGSGIKKAIEAWPQPIKTTADKLLENLESLKSDQSFNTPSRFRKGYIGFWARFTDRSNGVFKSKYLDSGTFVAAKFESLVLDELSKNILPAFSIEEKGVTTLVPALKAATTHNSESLKGWLSDLANDAEDDFNFRVQYFVMGEAQPKTLEVNPSGLRIRLRESVRSALIDVDEMLDANIKNTQDSKLNELVVLNFPKLAVDVNDLRKELSELDPGSSTFAESFRKCQAGLSTLKTSVEEVSDASKAIVGDTSKSLGRIRKNFDEDLTQIVNNFGNPVDWAKNTVDVEKAKKLAELLLELNENVTAEKSLKECVIGTDASNSLGQVIRTLHKSDYENRPETGTPYASRFDKLLSELDLLSKLVGKFDSGSQIGTARKNLPGLAGLPEALSILHASNDSRLSDVRRTLEETIETALTPSQHAIPDLYRQIIDSLSADLRNQLIAIWRGIHSTKSVPKIYAYKKIIPLFGFNAPEVTKVPGSDGGEVTSRAFTWGELAKQRVNNENWHVNWRDGKEVYLSQPVEAVTPDSTIIFRLAPNDRMCTVSSVLSPVQPGVLKISSTGSYVKLKDQELWHDQTITDKMPVDLLKSVSALLPSDTLTLVNVPIDDAVGDESLNESERLDQQSIELDGLYPDLVAGRQIFLSGERHGMEGVLVTEVRRIINCHHELAFANDYVHTWLVLDAPIKHRYVRSKTMIHANVVRATHGETTSQILGSGDASKAFQTMTLGKGPLTYLPAPNETGVESTLEVRVNDVQWHETQSLLESPSDGRNYVVQDQPEGMKTVQFGDGKTGARLPTGNSNVLATYRTGLGKAGNVRAKSITNLVDRPMGVKEVINPLPATGGADPETVEQIRANAPLAVMALDRLVSIRDYADFARNFAGIDKAIAMQCQVDSQPKICVTIAGADDAPLEGSELIRNLVQAYQRLGDPLQSIQVRTRELLLLFLGAKVRLKSDYLWESVKPRIQQSLYDRFSFARRELAQPVYLSDVYTAIQNVDGVKHVDVDLFGTLSQDKFQESLNQSQSSNATSQPDSSNANGANLSGLFETLVKGNVKQKLDAHSGKVNSKREFEPAQLIYLSPDVPDSLYLDEVKS
jgi:hypothetical protein